MRRKWAMVGLVAVALSCMWLATPAKAQPAEVDLGYFYDTLSPYGDWVDTDQYGVAWVPRDVPDWWRPYSDGRWVYTDEYGWYWNSYDPWGWITDHYGRWGHDRYYGSVWVPGYDWSPAWVAWRRGPDYIGWAPMSPEVGYEGGVGFSIGGLHFSLGGEEYGRHHRRHGREHDWERDVSPDSWVFVEKRHFVDPEIHPHAMSAERNDQLLRVTTDSTQYRQDPQHRMFNDSVPLKDLESSLGTKITPFKVQEEAKPEEMPKLAPPGGPHPAETAPQPGKGPVFGQPLQGNVVSIFHPAVKTPVPGATIPVPPKMKLEPGKTPPPIRFMPSLLRPLVTPTAAAPAAPTAVAPPNPPAPEHTIVPLPTTKERLPFLKPIEAPAPPKLVPPVVPLATPTAPHGEAAPPPTPTPERKLRPIFKPPVPNPPINIQRAPQPPPVEKVAPTAPAEPSTQPRGERILPFQRVAKPTPTPIPPEGQQKLQLPPQERVRQPREVAPPPPPLPAPDRQSPRDRVLQRFQKGGKPTPTPAPEQ